MRPLSIVSILIVLSVAPAAAWQMQLDHSLANAGGLYYQLSDERRIPPGWSDGLTFSTTTRSECAADTAEPGEHRPQPTPIVLRGAVVLTQTDICARAR